MGYVPSFRRVSHRTAALLAALLAATAVACSGGTAPHPGPPRTFRLGFSATPPRPTTELVLQTVDSWRPHADIALITQTVPWRALVSGTDAPLLVRRDLAPLAALYRRRDLPIIVQLDVTDGLAREREAPELVAIGRSIAEPEVQQRYRDYLLAVDSILHPDYLGLAMETNLVRAIAPPALYDAMRTMVVSGAAALSAQGSHAQRFVSVQVETAWGRLPATGLFAGVAADRADFPFVQALGLSSYPFLGGFAEPEQVPLDYYARLATSGGPALPLLVTEGGWSSSSVPGITSSPDRQARWITRQMALADRAALVAVTQINFTDIDPAAYQVPSSSILPLFARLGLVNLSFAPKPALAEWDRALRRPLAP